VRKHGEKRRQGRPRRSPQGEKPGGFGVVPLGFATDAQRESAGSFTFTRPGSLSGGDWMGCYNKVLGAITNYLSKGVRDV
jgi:hypothetical protein